ncbi:MAG: DUF2752 domain-containing protein [bacterium]|nr:DUF2752 domain-containing protein [bacterium]
MRRLGWLLLPSVALLVIALASILEPHPSGMGTHRALGLPPCFFLFLTGWICPSCGLTTSFTHLAHGNFLNSFYAHPLGPVLFIAMCVLALFSLGEFLGRRTPLTKFFQGHYASWIYGGLSAYLLIWGGRLFWMYYP